MKSNRYQNYFEVIVRAVIEDKGKILLCRNKKKNYYYLPGGHLEFGEKIDKALAREIKEELNLKVEKSFFIGMVDNIFIKDKKDKNVHHEINLIFKTKVNKIHTVSQEKYIDFILMSKKEFLKEKKIYPITLKKQLIKWFKNKKIFYIS